MVCVQVKRSDRALHAKYHTKEIRKVFVNYHCLHVDALRDLRNCHILLVDYCFGTQSIHFLDSHVSCWWESWGNGSETAVHLDWQTGHFLFWLHAIPLTFTVAF
jgi:hypothetical protein